jgi:hypothetical protein
MKSIFSIILFTLTFIPFFWDCAIKQPPAGGPEDKKPPEMVYSIPKADSINVKKLSFIEVKFDESVDKSSFNKQVWIIPEPEQVFELEWKGSKILQLKLLDSLEANQTYIVTIGTGVKDMRGNPLTEPIVIPFSTGSKIDRCEIIGKVYDKNPEGVYVYAYELTDTFSIQAIFQSKPRYYTQLSKSGDFKLGFLRPGNYWVFVLDDVNRDNKYTLQTDRIGIPSGDIWLDSLSKKQSKLNFTMIVEDTTPPQYSRFDTLHQTGLQVQFTEPLLKNQSFEVEIQDSLSGGNLSVLANVIDEDNPESVIIFTERQQSMRYLIRMGSIQDTTGNYNSDGEIYFSFWGASQADTTTPRLTKLFPGNSVKNIVYDADIQIEFNLPVDTLSLINEFQMISEDSLKVAGEWDFGSVIKPKFTPDTLLPKNKNFFISLDLQKVYTIYNQSFGDSIYRSKFNSVDWSDLGELSGLVKSNNPMYKKSLIRTSQIRGSNAYSMQINVGQEYLMPFVFEGIYKIQAGIDINENGKLDQGSTIPFRFSEPFIVLSDTVKVRKRWTTQGINFQF